MPLSTGKLLSNRQRAGPNRAMQVSTKGRQASARSPDEGGTEPERGCSAPTAANPTSPTGHSSSGPSVGYIERAWTYAVRTVKRLEDRVPWRHEEVAPA